VQIAVSAGLENSVWQYHEAMPLKYDFSRPPTIAEACPAGRSGIVAVKISVGLRLLGTTTPSA